MAGQSWQNLPVDWLEGLLSKFYTSREEACFVMRRGV
jgi:hypothetical protein